MADESKKKEKDSGFRKEIQNDVNFGAMKARNIPTMRREYCPTCDKHTPHSISTGLCSWCVS